MLWTLSNPVSIVGPDYFGRRSVMSLSPACHREMKWCGDANHDSLSLRPELCSCPTRRLVLRGGERKLEIAEHILPLRLQGLVGVDIISSCWPPYFGRTIEVLQAAEAQKKELGPGTSWYEVSRSVSWHYPCLRGGRQAFTTIYPSSGDYLEIEVTVCYSGIGEKTINFRLPDQEMLRRICAARTPGWPPRLHWASKLASFFWPHHNKIAWPQMKGEGDLLEEYALHRAQDLIGMLAFFCRDGMFCGRVVSVCSGHEADWHVLKKAFPLLRKK